MKNELVLLACCSLHRGGEKCTVDGCDTGAREKTGMCSKQGGGLRCKVDEWNKGARDK